MAVLHDRGLPRGKANLDHLVVTATGVWIIDAKTYTGHIELEDTGTATRPGPRLRVNGRDRTDKLVSGSRWQTEQVRNALNPTYRDVPVRLAVCFVDAKRRLRSKPRTIDGVLITWEKDIVGRLRRPGPLDERWRSAIQRHLATRFRPAADRVS